MRRLSRRAVVAVVFTSVAATGCATKGALREAVEEQRAALAEQQAALDTERAERQAADERLASDLAALRADLDAMRAEFDAEIEAVAEGLKFVLPVHFAYDDDQVRPSDYPALEAFASIVNRHYAGSLVTIEGFTDPAGSAAYNRALAQRRADAVRDRLIETGIQAQLRSVGYGEDRLVVPGAYGEEPGAELNRRAVFVIESPSSPQPVAAADLPRG